jgi:hypothetical protein
VQRAKLIYQIITIIGKDWAMTFIEFVGFIACLVAHLSLQCIILKDSIQSWLSRIILNGATQAEVFDLKAQAEACLWEAVCIIRGEIRADPGYIYWFLPGNTI